MGYFYRQGNRVEVCEELLQEVFVKIWKTRHYRVQAKFSTWMYRVAQRILIDHWRKQGRRPHLISEADSPEVVDSIAFSLEEQALRRERQQLLQAALAQLSTSQRQVIVLSKFQQLKYADIAQILRRLWAGVWPMSRCRCTGRCNS